MKVAAHLLRTRFAAALSAMYVREVPLYGDLLEIVAAVNAAVIAERPEAADNDAGRLALERHGAIRVGHPAELAELARLFAAMGMAPIGYYDLAPAGIPVHSTAFRPASSAALTQAPFRIFTSLLRLELITDPALRSAAEALLARRRIVPPEVRALAERALGDDGLDEADATAFIAGAIDIFRWRGQVTVDRAGYVRLKAAHPLVADVVAFPNPHINHLTPRTLDIDRTHAAMAARGLRVKASIEGPPRRAVPVLLRQTSFHALEEPVRFAGESGSGGHTARFGEIEQRGLALTPEGRARYDRALHGGVDAAWADLPDDAEALRRAGLGYFRYEAAAPFHGDGAGDLDALIAAGAARARPITYEDFLPVSAAGIFRSNLAGHDEASPVAASSQAAFEAALGRELLDPFALYAAEERASIERLYASLGARPPNVLRK